MIFLCRVRKSKVWKQKRAKTIGDESKGVEAQLRHFEIPQGLLRHCAGRFCRPTYRNSNKVQQHFEKGNEEKKLTKRQLISR